MKRFFLFKVFVLFLCSQSFAQYIGPGSSSKYYTSIQSILNNPIEDANVVLEGYLIKQLKKDKFLFSDKKFEIVVEIDDDLLKNKIIRENTKIKIVGEVEKDFGKVPEIDVDYLEIIK